MKEVWLRATGPKCVVELPSGGKFVLGSEPTKFTGDNAVFAKTAARHCHGVTEVPAPSAASAPEDKKKASAPPAAPAAPKPAGKG